MGMGWPQQLDVRLDGKLLKRFTVGGKAPGTPAAASYAGDGEPGFAGAPEWETYMQLTGDAGLEVRVPVDGRPARRRRVVRARAVGAGRPAAAAAARPRARPTTRSTWATPASASVQIGGPYTRRRARRRTRRAAARSSSVEPTARSRTRRACATKILSRMARLAYRRPVTTADVQTLLEFFDDGRQRRRQLRRRASSSRSSGCWSIRISCCGSIAIRRPPRPAPAAVSPERPRARLAAVVLPVEQHPRRAPARPGRARRAVEAGGARTAGAAHAGRSARDRRAGGRLRRAVAEPAARRRSGRRIRTSIRTSTTTCCEAFKQETELFVASTLREDRSVLGSAARRLHVRQRAAGAALRHSRASTAAASGASRCPNPDQRGGLLAHGALLATTSYPDRTSPVLRGKWLLDNIFGVTCRRRRRTSTRRCPKSSPARVPPTIRERLAQHRHQSGVRAVATR